MNEERKLVDSRGRILETGSSTRGRLRDGFGRLSRLSKAVLASGFFGAAVGLTALWVNYGATQSQQDVNRLSLRPSIDVQYWLGPSPSDLAKPDPIDNELPEGVTDLRLVESAGDWYWRGSIDTALFDIQCVSEICRYELSVAEPDDLHGTIWLVVNNNGPVSMKAVEMEWLVGSVASVESLGAFGFLTDLDGAAASETLVDLVEGDGLLLPLATVLVLPDVGDEVRVVPLGEIRRPFEITYGTTGTAERVTEPIREPSDSIVVGGFDKRNPFRGGG